jgi:hypothetical protein
MYSGEILPDQEAIHDGIGHHDQDMALETMNIYMIDLEFKSNLK